MSTSKSEVLTTVTVITTPETLVFNNSVLAYDHINGVVGYVGGPIGQTRELTLPLEIARRFIKIAQDLDDGEQMNCHGFARAITDIPTYESAPFSMLARLPVVEELPVGSPGVITARGTSRDVVPNSIGYGLGGDSLQVMTGGGELGIAGDAVILDFYKEYYPGLSVSLHAYGS